MMGLPPELLAALSGGGQQQDPAGQGGSPDSQIQQALDLIRAAMTSDGELSEQERLTLEKVTTLLQGIPAQREKDQQAAMGSSPAMNHIRRATGGTGGY